MVPEPMDRRVRIRGIQTPGGSDLPLGGPGKPGLAPNLEEGGKVIFTNARPGPPTTLLLLWQTTTKETEKVGLGLFTGVIMVD